MTNILGYKEIHQILLSILEAVIEVCEANSIEYYLAGGGCLGIVRHDHNLIPWDDDLDIVIWAGDLPRLVAALQSLPHPYATVIYDRMPHPIVKIMDTTTKIFVESNDRAWNDGKEGIFIDVVPMMHWRSERWKKLDECYALFAAAAQSPFSPTRWKRLIKTMLHQSGVAKLVCFLGRQVYEPIVSRMNEDCRRKKVGIVSGAVGRKWPGRYPIEMIFPLRKERLGRLTVNVPNDLHGYVARRYGPRFMETPEEDDLWKHFEKAIRLEKSGVD